ncbi:MULTISPECIES: FUSC family protein [unclassified Cupriavidus]|uniref:FUSC family protein n=1 Tax=unclassified Cupriavidus TaxID=2640874 RepID=UPI001AEA7BAD|nr:MULTISPECIES: FUSC family protein [unclassified Cupriavidus]MBP0632430.1 FUSC family protein [Cupriavidus sp. AcVe19-1a]MBP0638602.1 FUSC family protein [Cupriavidus sp. AcVe19-6a]
MQYAHDPRTFLYSHYVYRGLRSATGVIGATLIALQFSDLPTAMVVSMGALCTSLMDLPSPLSHKFNEMLASVLLCSAVTLVVALTTPFPRVMPFVLVLVTFLAAMMTVYGNKTLPLQFAALFVMTLTINEDFVVERALVHAAHFSAGAVAYLGYAMLVSWLTERRTRQQVLAESLYELAGYLEIKAGFYDAGNNYEARFNQLVRQQIVVAERQQAARDLVLRGNRTPHDGLLVQVHLRMLDLYEYVLSTNTDYPLLRQTFGGTPVLDHLRGLVVLMCKDVEEIAYEVTRGRGSYATVEYREGLRAVEAEIAQLRHHHINPAAMTALAETLDMIRGAVTLIGQLHEASRTPVEPAKVLPGSDMTPFLTRQKYELGVLRDNLHWRSPAFRFALRMSMAVALGLWITNHLPYVSHSYWILLTIIVILKPNFSMTKQRYNDRVIGTLIGCVVAVGILKVVDEPLILLGVLFLSLVASAAFVTIKYRYTAIAACIQVLIQINLLMPGSPTVAGERLVDTVIGGIIASLFSFVLPSWEYRAIPKLVENVLQANRRYIAATRDLLLRRAKDDFAYRVQRKQFMDNLSALISSFQRMLDEPRSRHRAVDNLNRFIVQNYLVAAHVAAARIQVRQHYAELDIPAAEAAIEQATEAARSSLQLASERLHADERGGGRGAGFIRRERAPVVAEVQVPLAVAAGPAMGDAAAAVEAAEDAAAERRARLADSADKRRTDTLVQAAAAGESSEQAGPTSSSTGRPANAVLERRLRALREDAAKIALRTGAIGRAMRARS